MSEVWHVKKGEVVIRNQDGTFIADFSCGTDATYAVKAVNAYPKLIEALINISGMGYPGAAYAYKLLKELGE